MLEVWREDVLDGRMLLEGEADLARLAPDPGGEWSELAAGGFRVPVLARNSGPPASARRPTCTK